MSDTPTAVPLEGATPAEQAQNLYESLKPLAIGAAREFVLRQTPADLQDEMLEVIAADLPEPEVPVKKLPWDTPKGIIGQVAAQMAAKKAADAMVGEVPVEDPPAPMEPGPTQTGGSVPPSYPPASLDNPPPS